MNRNFRLAENATKASNNLNLLGSYGRPSTPAEHNITLPGDLVEKIAAYFAADRPREMREEIVQEWAEHLTDRQQTWGA